MSRVTPFQEVNVSLGVPLTNFITVPVAQTVILHVRTAKELTQIAPHVIMVPIYLTTLALALVQ